MWHPSATWVWKLFMPISTNDGEVVKILVEDGQPVEFGQTLVILK